LVKRSFLIKKAFPAPLVAVVVRVAAEIEQLHQLLGAHYSTAGHAPTLKNNAPLFAFQLSFSVCPEPV
jgi:hypothetical protein